MLLHGLTIVAAGTCIDPRMKTTLASIRARNLMGRTSTVESYHW